MIKKSHFHSGKFMKIKSFVKSAEKLDRRRALGPIILRSYFTLSLSPFLAIQALTRRKTEKERISSRSKNRKWAKIHHLFRSSGKNIQEITISRRWITRFIRVLSKLGWEGGEGFINSCGISRLYSRYIPLPPHSLPPPLPRLGLDLNFKRNATAHDPRDETVARGEGGGKREEARRKRRRKNCRIFAYTRRCILLLVEDF